MVLAIASYGTAIRKDGNYVTVEHPDTKQRFHIHEISAVVLSVPCTLTSSVITLCHTK